MFAGSKYDETRFAKPFKVACRYPLTEVSRECRGCAAQLSVRCRVRETYPVEDSAEVERELEVLVFVKLAEVVFDPRRRARSLRVAVLEVVPLDDVNVEVVAHWHSHAICQQRGHSRSTRFGNAAASSQVMPPGAHISSSH